MWSLKKSCVKYQVVDDGISMHDDKGLAFSMNFSHRKPYWEISCMFAGTSIVMPMYPGFVKFGHLNFSHLKNSQEMLDQKC